MDTSVQKCSKGDACPITMCPFKVAYYSFPKKEIKILKSVKLKKQDVSSEVLVTAIEVKCNFTKKPEMQIRGKC